MIELFALAQECAPNVRQETLAAIVKTESSYNPYAIGVVAGKLERQPKNKEEAIATAKALEAAGWNYSLGLTQINKHNLPLYSVSIKEAFDPCINLKIGAQIFNECRTRAQKKTENTGLAFSMALSCYYSGNFETGFKKGPQGGPSYVEKIAANLSEGAKVIPVIPNQKEKEGSYPPTYGPVLLKLDEKTSIEEGEEGQRNEEAKTQNPKIVF